KSYDKSEGRRVDSYEEGVAAARGEEPSSDLSDAKPGDSIAAADEFFTKDDDGLWYDVDGESLTDSQLERRLRGKDYEKVSQEDSAPAESDEESPEQPEAPEAPETPSEERTDAPEAEEAPEADKEIPEKVQEELEEAVEAFDPEDDDTAENIAAL